VETEEIMTTKSCYFSLKNFETEVTLKVKLLKQC